ncbi:MAG: peroxide stress protein YaaA, partial [Bacteroidota bacterium]
TISRKKLTELMGISKNLAQLNYERYLEWEPEFSPGVAKQAILAFKGDVYLGLDAPSFTEEDFDFAQQHLRILSGLHGLLRPLDLIRPYRLEMGTRLKIRRKKDLYHFWGERLTDKMNETLTEADSNIVINLASKEYFSALQPETLKARIITPSFLDFKNGNYKMISFFAKKARGMMSAYLIKHRITNAEDIKAFDVGGYYFSEERSTEDNWVFLRDEP